jgi:Ca2+-binding EF-hand superfamily protein
MQKQFKIIDDNNSGSIDMSEFRKGIKDFRVDLNDNEI